MSVMSAASKRLSSRFTRHRGMHQDALDGPLGVLTVPLELNSTELPSPSLDSIWPRHGGRPTGSIHRYGRGSGRGQRRRDLVALCPMRSCLHGGRDGSGRFCIVRTVMETPTRDNWASPHGHSSRLPITTVFGFVVEAISDAPVIHWP